MDQEDPILRLIRENNRKYSPYISEKTEIKFTANSTTLLFPKEFEFLLFLECIRKYLLKVEQKYINSFYRCQLKKDELFGDIESDEVPVLYCYVPGKSDFDFYICLRDLAKWGCGNFYLIGSCGSVNGEKGKCYFIQDAYQADRGILQKDNRFVSRHTPKDNKLGNSLQPKVPGWQKKYDGKNIKLECATTFSSHFLNEADYMKDFCIGQNLSPYVYDMETYYFYQGCKEVGAHDYACFRFVTDKVIREEKDIQTNCFEITNKLKTIDTELAFDELMKYFEVSGFIDSEQFDNFYLLLRKLDRRNQKFDFPSNSLPLLVTNISKPKENNLSDFPCVSLSNTHQDHQEIKDKYATQLYILQQNAKKDALEAFKILKDIYG